MRCRLCCALLGLVLGALLCPAPALAHATLLQSEPAGGTGLAMAPDRVVLWFSEPPEPRFSDIRVTDATGRRVDRGDVRTIAGDPATLTVSLAAVPAGAYTVTWRTGAAYTGHVSSGTLAFTVGTATRPLAPGGGTTYASPQPVEVALRWLILLAVGVLVGAVGAAPILVRSALRRASGGTVPSGAAAAALERRRAVLGGLCLAVLWPATILALALRLRAATGRPDGAALADALTRTWLGQVGMARLLPLIAMAVALRPARLFAARRAATREVRLADISSVAVLVLSAGYLLTLSLTNHAAASPFWAPFAVMLDWGHLLAAAWLVGGLVGLAAALPVVLSLPESGARAGATLIARFGAVTAIGLIVSVLTGLYLAWLQIGSPDELRLTEYGRTLLVKLTPGLGLLALGAFFLLWLRPRLLASPAGGVARGPLAILARWGTRAGLFAALLAAAIVLPAAILGGLVPARAAIVALRAPAPTQASEAGDLRLVLTLASLQPGDNRFDLLVRQAGSGAPPRAIERVSLRLDMLDMQMPGTTIEAVPLGDGHYAVSGPYLSMSGRWQARTTVRRAGMGDVEANFRLEIGSAANRAATPTVPVPPRLGAPSPARGFGLLLLGGAIAIALAALRYLPPVSLARVFALGCVPAVLLAGGYLLLSDARPGGAGVARGTPTAPTNPVTADAGSLNRGRALFAANCVACHGVRGRGDGPLAPTLLPRPANLGDAHMVGHRDADLFGFISNGVPGSAMAAWRDQLTKRERWDLVNYVRTFAPVAVGAAGTPGGPNPAIGQRPPAQLSSAPVPSTLGGQLIYAAEGRLWSLDVAGGSPVDLTPGRSRATLAADPALAPDGTTLAFTLLALPTLGPPGTPITAPGADIYVLNLRDGGQRLALAHDQPAALIESLNWTPDGRALIYAYSTPVLATDGQLTGTRHELQRLDLATGQRTTLVADALSPALSRDGKTLAYVAINPQTFETSLWLASADGSDRHQLVGTQGGFADFLAPRFSPDGTQVVFSVAGGPGVAPPQPSPPTSGVPQRLFHWLVAPFTPQSAAAHGLPGDLWLVGRDGKEVQRLTAIYEDQPIPAWSADGQWVAILGGGGVYIVRADGAALVRRSRTGGAGALIWRDTEVRPASPTRGP